MHFLRSALIWILVLCLPVEGMAANLMSHCKDMQMTDAVAEGQAMSHHDHAAMMAMGGMADEEMAAMPDHHMMHGDSMEAPAEAADDGCECGCKCSGNCAVSCASMMFGLVQMGLVADSDSSSHLVIAPRGQAHAAYRYDPLRPPSAVAL